MRRIAIACWLVLLLATTWARGQSADAPLAETAPPDAEAAEELAALKRPQRFWVRADYMLWWVKSANLPPLVTTGSFTQTLPGALGSLDTKVLFGGDGADFRDRQGGKLTLGWWLDDEQALGVEAAYSYLGGRSIKDGFASPGAPVLATPFFNVLTSTQDAGLITYPGILNGRILLEARTMLHGGNADLVGMVACGEHCRVDALVGFRYLGLNESLRIDSTSRVELAPQFQGMGIPFEGSTITVGDRFDARNHFFGGEIGTRVELSWKRFLLDLDGKIALGAASQTVANSGFTTIDTARINAGFYAVASNSGDRSRTSFAVVPEVGATLKFQLTERLRLSAGYSFLYWSSVVRPGEQVDLNVNPNLVPTSTTFGAAGGPQQPSVPFRTTDFFAHGASFGLEFRY